MQQVIDTLEDKLAIGESKHAAKRIGVADEYIYSWATFRTYLRHCCYFVKWCREQHNCRTLEECRRYADEWLASRSELSAYTQKLEASALAKLYSCRSQDFIQTKKRSRGGITRSRGVKVRDKHFSVEKHEDIINFCKATGLRRAELTALRGDKLILNNGDGNVKIKIDTGAKGGRAREVLVIGTPEQIENVVNLMQNAGNNKVFEKVPGGMDVHSYRAEYATTIYKLYARPTEGLKRSDKYFCRRDRKGLVLDRQAMLITSQNLGHNRINIIAEHYLIL